MTEKVPPIVVCPDCYGLGVKPADIPAAGAQFPPALLPCETCDGQGTLSRLGSNIEHS